MLDYICASKVSNVIKGIKDTAMLLKDLKQYYPYLQELYFAGGEPLLYKENLDILYELDKLRCYDVQLIYNTNFTQLNKNKDFMKLWKKFNRLTIWISVDGSGKKGEYLRKGLKWEDISDNLNVLNKECPNADISIRFTVSVFNILHLPDFHKEIIERYLKADKIYFNIVDIPNYYSVKIFPKELKEQVNEKIKNHIIWLKQQEPFNQGNNILIYKFYLDRWNAILKYMNSEDWTHLIPQFIEVTNKLDNLRNENFIDIFPELESLYKK